MGEALVARRGSIGKKGIGEKISVTTSALSLSTIGPGMYILDYNSTNSQYIYDTDTAHKLLPYPSINSAGFFVINVTKNSDGTFNIENIHTDGTGLKTICTSVTTVTMYNYSYLSMYRLL